MTEHEKAVEKKREELQGRSNEYLVDSILAYDDQHYLDYDQDGNLRPDAIASLAWDISLDNYDMTEEQRETLINVFAERSIQEVNLTGIGDASPETEFILSPAPTAFDVRAVRVSRKDETGKLQYVGDLPFDLTVMHPIAEDITVTGACVNQGQDRYSVNLQIDTEHLDQEYADVRDIAKARGERLPQEGASFFYRAPFETQGDITAAYIINESLDDDSSDILRSCLREASDRHVPDSVKDLHFNGPDFSDNIATMTWCMKDKHSGFVEMGTLKELSGPQLELVTEALNVNKQCITHTDAVIYRSFKFDYCLNQLTDLNDALSELDSLNNDLQM